MTVSISGAGYYVNDGDVPELDTSVPGYLAVGDSITAFRAGVLGYVDRLAPGLGASGIRRIRNAGIYSAASQDVIDRWTETRPYQKATVMLGVNDEAGGVTVPQFQSRLGTICDLILALPGMSKLVLMTPTFVYNQSNPTGFCDAVQAVALARSLTVVDTYAICLTLRNGSDATWTQSYTIGDGVHPNSAANLAFFNALSPALGL